MFAKNREPDCEYCSFGYVLSNETECICKKYGLIERKSSCRKFKYDPLRRNPKHHPNTEKYSTDDFSIDERKE